MPHVSGGGSHSGGHHSSSGGSRSFGGSHSGGYRSSSFGSSRSFGGSHSGGYRSSFSGGSRSYGGSSGRSYGGSHASGYRSTPSGGVNFQRSMPRPSNRVSPIASAAYFAGAKRYVYYRNNQPRYVYSDFETVKPKFHFFRFLFWLFLLLCAISVLKDDINASKPAAVTPGPGEAAVVDSIGVIGDPDALQTSLEAFRQASGITPCVATIYDENWKNEFADLDTKALDFYVKAFQDEKHWVLLYSQPETPASDFVDWSWTSVQGDETNRLTSSLADDFGETLQKNLMSDTRYTVGEAFRLAFDALTEKMTPVQAEKDRTDIVIAILMVLAIAYIGGRRSGIIRKRLKRPDGVPEDAVPAGPETSAAPETAEAKEETAEKAENTEKEKPDEVACEYCGGVFARSRLTCPHCGAVRKKKKE